MATGTPFTQPRLVLSLVALMAIAVPCPVTLLFCSGLVPLATLAGVIGVTVASAPLTDGLIVLTPLAVEGTLYLWLMRWIAARLVRRSRPRTLAFVAAALLILAATPVYFFDCMDGHTVTRCSVVDMLRGAVLPARQCGDLGW